MLSNLSIDLTLFGEGTGGDGASASASEGASAEQGGSAVDTASLPISPTRRSKKNDVYANVKFGKQATSENETEATASVGPTEETPKEESPEDRQKAYQDLVKGKYKDLFTADTQRIINQRFKENKAQEETLAKQGKVLDFLMQRYDVKDLDGLQSAIDNDDSMWESAADEAGMTVKQY